MGDRDLLREALEGLRSLEYGDPKGKWLTGLIAKITAALDVTPAPDDEPWPGVIDSLDAPQEPCPACDARERECPKVPCCVCGTPTCTRKMGECEHSDGAELTNGRWACSSICWDKAAGPAWAADPRGRRWLIATNARACSSSGSGAPLAALTRRTACASE